MELNVTRETVCINDLSFNQNVEQGVDFTVNIPEYCGSVERILKYSLVPRICSKSISGQILSLEGSACFSIIYVDDSGCVSSYEANTPFSKNIDLGSNLECFRSTVSARCGYINAKAITPSRIDVNSVIELSVRVYSKKKTEIVSDIDCSDIFVNKGEAAATIPIGCSEKNIIIEEELSIPAEMPSIFNIIRHDCDIAINDTKIVNNKIIAKGELNIHFLYSSENRRNLSVYEQTIPFSQIIEMEGLNDTCECEVSADIISVDLKPRSNYNGEVRCVLLCAKVSLIAKANCNHNIPIIYDAYSSKFDTISEMGEASFESIINSVSEVFECKKKIPFSDGEIGKIHDLWGQCSLQSFHAEENHLHISGTAIISGLCENGEGTANFFERPIDFEYKTNIGVLPDDRKIEPSLKIISISSGAVSADSIEVCIEIALSVQILEINKISVLTGFSAKDEPLPKLSNCSMIIYYAERGELTWNIAKKFNASPEDIMAINSVSSVIPNDMPLVISC